MSISQNSDEKKDTGWKGRVLNFKVNRELKQEFRSFAIANKISLVDLFKEGFELSKEKRLK